MDLIDLSSPVLVLPHLPRSLRFEGVQLNAENSTSVPCEMSSVTEDSETWRVDLSAFQAVAVELRQPDASLYLGPALFFAGPSEEQLTGPISFERGPFVLLYEGAADLCVFVFEPEGLLLESDATLAGQPTALRQGSIGWH